MGKDKNQVMKILQQELEEPNTFYQCGLLSRIGNTEECLDFLFSRL
jgi:hypothetical protein